MGKPLASAEATSSITHYSHPHPLHLISKSTFHCHACGNGGAGFSYHCSTCAIDLHTTCASLPMNLTHHSHHHPLTLTLSAPYPGNTQTNNIDPTQAYRPAANGRLRDKMKVASQALFHGLIFGGGDVKGGNGGYSSSCSGNIALSDDAALRNLENAAKFSQIDDECILCHEQGHTRNRCPNI